MVAEVAVADLALDHDTGDERQTPGSARRELLGDPGPADDLAFVPVALHRVDGERVGGCGVALPVAEWTEVLTADAAMYVAQGSASAGVQPADADLVPGGAELRLLGPSSPAAAGVCSVG